MTTLTGSAWTTKQKGRHRLRAQVPVQLLHHSVAPPKKEPYLSTCTLRRSAAQAFAVLAVGKAAPPATELPQNTVLVVIQAVTGLQSQSPTSRGWTLTSASRADVYRLPKLTMK